MKQAPKVEEVKLVTQTPVEEKKQPEPTPTVVTSAAATPAATPAPELKTNEYTELEEKLAALKEKGNNQFRKKAYKEAIKHFSEAVKLFEETGRPSDKGDIKTKITQILTNRSTSFHLLNQQSSAASDATLVLDLLDSTNKKALFRRAHALKT